MDAYVMWLRQLTQSVEDLCRSDHAVKQRLALGMMEHSVERLKFLVEEKAAAQRDPTSGAVPPRSHLSISFGGQGGSRTVLQAAKSARKHDA